MIKDFKNKNSDGRLLIKKCFFGLGFHLNFISATFERQKKYSIIIDFIFIRFWWNVYEKSGRHEYYDNDFHNGNILFKLYLFFKLQFIRFKYWYKFKFFNELPF